jgi:hypothetical protein
VVVSVAAKESLSDTLGLTGMPPPAAQEAMALENVEAGWWKRKEAGLVLGAGFVGSGFSLSQSSLEVGRWMVGFIQYYPWKIQHLRV